jgi:pimeloyl-ACP methyl ester carboxylesterase
VQILVPGVTYDHHYFDLEGGGDVVSQARQTAREGWLVLALDRVGTGDSSKPPAASVTTAVQVTSIDHFVDKIASMYRRLPIVLVGHSYGSVVAEGVAAASNKIDALVITGFMYRRTSPSFEGFPELTPTATDPVLGKQTLPAGYLTTAPNSRKFFYYLPNANRATLVADERTKSTTTAAEVPGFAQELASRAFATAVRVPVLVVVGDNDYLYQGDDPAAFEPDQKSAFGAAASVQAVLIPNAAHDLALHRNAPFTTALINRWASSAVASSASALRD